MRSHSGCSVRVGWIFWFGQKFNHPASVRTLDPKIGAKRIVCEIDDAGSIADRVGVQRRVTEKYYQDQHRNDGPSSDCGSDAKPIVIILLAPAVQILCHIFLPGGGA
jgi:hypothetical protein